MWILSTLGSVAAKAVWTKVIEKVATKVAARPILRSKRKSEVFSEFAWTNIDAPSVSEVMPNTFSKDKISSSPLTQWAVAKNDYQTQSDEYSSAQELKTEILNKDLEAREANKLYRSETWENLFNINKPSIDNEDIIASANKLLDKQQKLKSTTANVRSVVQSQENKNNAINEVTSLMKDIENYKSPNSTIKNTLKKVVWKEKFEEFDNEIQRTNMYLWALRSDEQLRKDIPTWARSISSWLAFDKLADWYTWWDLRNLNQAADYLNETWELQESQVARTVGQIIWDAPVYYVASVAWLSVAWEGMVSLWVASNSSKLVKSWMGVLKLKSTNPYLYEATFDSAFGTATEYGVRKMSWYDYTLEDWLRSAVLGAVMPKVVWGVAEWVENTIKYWARATSSLLKPKDFTKLDKIIEAWKKSQESLKETLENNRWVTFSDWTTLWDVLDAQAKNTSKEFTEIDAQLHFSKNWVAVSNLASKKIKQFIDANNKEIEKWAKDSSERALAIQDFVGKINLLKSVNSDDVSKLISEIKASHNIVVDWKKIIETSDDVINDLLHTPTFQLQWVKKASTISEITEAFKKQKVVTVDDVNKTRLMIDTDNTKSIESIEKLAKARWIKFDVDKAVDKVWLTDKNYLNSVVDEIESDVIGYAEYSKKIANKVKDDITAEKKNLATIGKTKNSNILNFSTKDVAREAWKVLDDLNASVRKLVKELDIATNQKAKKVIQQTIDRKNKEIDKIKASNKEAILNLKSKTKKRDEEKLALRNLIRSEIDSFSTRPEYSSLKPSEIKAIADSHKVMIMGARNLDDAERIILSLNKKLYKSAFDKTYSSIEKQIKRVNKEVSSNKASRIHPYFVKQMKELANELEWKVSLERLWEISYSLDLFEKTWREVFAEFQKYVNTNSINDFVLVSKNLLEQNKPRIEAPWYNTPERGIGSWKSVVESTIEFIEWNVQSHYAIDRMFWVGSHWAKIFNLDVVTAASKHIATHDKIRDSLIPKLWQSIFDSKNISWSKDSRLNKFDMWRRRNSWWNVYNYWNNMVVERDKNWMFQYVALSDANNLNSNQFYFQSLDWKERQAILDSWYKEFDNDYVNNVEFRKYEDELRTHFKTQWDEIQEKFARNAWKQFLTIENYHPNIHKNKFNNTSVTDDSLNYDTYARDSINDWFKHNRTPPKWPISLSTDFASNIMYSVNTATYWNNTIEPVIRMQKLLNKLRSWNIKWSEEIYTDDDLLNIWKLTSKVEYDNDSGILSPEAYKLLKAHIEKIATQWGSIRWKMEANILNIVNRVQSTTIPMLLGWPKTIAKQASGLADNAAYGWIKNANSWFISTFWRWEAIGMVWHKNLKIAMEDTWYLRSRMPPYITDEWKWMDFITQWNLRLTTKFRLWRDKYIANTFGNMIKTIDWYTSFNAWMTGVSKYLDEVHPDVHRAWRLIDLENIKKSLSPEDYRAMVWYADKYMNKIVWSTHAIDQWLESGWMASKLVFFLWKTWLNHTMFMFENLKRIFGKNPNIGYWERAFHAASLALSQAAIYWYWKALDYTLENVNVALWAITAEDAHKYRNWMGWIIDSPTFNEIVMAEVWYALNMMFVSPQTGLSVIDIAQPIVTWAWKIYKAPTLGRALEETAYLTVSWLGWVHQFYMDTARKWISMATWKDFTKVWNKEYDKKVTEVQWMVLEWRSSLEWWEKASWYERMTWMSSQWQKFPKWKNLDELLSTMNKVSTSQKKISDRNKSIKENKDLLVSWYIEKYWNWNVDINNFRDYVTTHKDELVALWIDTKWEANTFMTMIEVKNAKSARQEKSILMGKPIEVIFDVKVKEYVERWDLKWAEAKVNELIRDWYIKNKSWADNIMKLIYRPQTSR